MTLPYQRNHSHFSYERLFLLKFAVVLIAVPSLLVLYGWLFKAQVLEWLFPNGISMKANTAFAFILSSLGLVLFLGDSRIYRRIQRVCAIILVMIGTITLYQHMTDRNLFYFDSALVQFKLMHPETHQNSLFANRMSPLSAINWVFIGCSLFLLTFRRYQILNIARLLVLPVFLTSIMVLIGYAYGVRELYSFGFYTPLSPLSAIIFIILSISLGLIQAERGFMRLFVGNTLGSKMARWLLPTLIITFITIGWLCRQGNLMHWYNNQFEVSMLIFFTLFLSSCLIIWQARAQHGQELLRQRAQHALEMSNHRLEKKVIERTHELEELTKKLEALSLTDTLTKLGNRRAFEQRMEIEWERAARYGSPLSLIVLDVDYFKRFNDDFGHAVGDKVLCNLGQILAATVRTTDLPCRYGGEEFVVILPNTPLQEAISMAERIREEVEHFRWENRNVTISLGVASLEHQTNSRELFNQADQALYNAKAAGRNRVMYS